MKGKLNALEMAIFSAVCLVFLNSVYRLFMDGRLMGDPSRTPVAKQETVTQTKSEPVAGFVPYETKCQPSGEIFETSATKVRILGPFCGAAVNNPGRQIAATDDEVASTTAAKPLTLQLLEYKIENTTNHYVATVFSDPGSGKFSTDFVPLESGSNKLVMEFKYKGGRVFPVELTVIRK